MYPCGPKTAEKVRSKGKEADCAATRARKDEIRRDYGVIGESPLYSLYDLCLFDPVRDGVIDIMHALSLNLRILADLGDVNKSKLPMDRNPKEGGVLTSDELQFALNSITWTKELRSGRIPAVSGSGLGHWKAEEYNKFSLVAPFVLRNLIPKSVYECFILLSDMRSMV